MQLNLDGLELGRRLDERRYRREHRVQVLEQFERTRRLERQQRRPQLLQLGL